MTDALQKLFGSASRVKLLRLFLFNPAERLTVAEAALRAQVSEDVVRSEVSMLVGVGMLRRSRRGNVVRFGLNTAFPYYDSLQKLLLNVSGRGGEVRDRLRRTGNIKLVLIAGIFVGEWNAAIDLMVVGDRVNNTAFKKYLRSLESEIGKEIRYTLLSTKDFFYRFNMSDKLMRDTFDYPHQIVLDKLDIGLK